MATKTITITEDAYQLLADSKLKSESFSQGIRRLLSRRKSRTLSDFFGVLSEKEGKQMHADLEKIRSVNMHLLKNKVR